MKKILLSLLILIAILCGVVLSMQSSSEWSAGEVVRTPEARFENLPDYAFQPNYIDIEGYRIHYVDEGPKDGEVILLMHGQPSWSYLYRHMIPLLSDLGYRVIAPDNVGFGKSDKPVDWSSHSYQMHVDIMSGFVDSLDLNGINLFAQDWGGLISLRVVEQRPDRFARIMISNTFLPGRGGIEGWIGYPLSRLMVWAEGEVQDMNLEDESFSFSTWIAYSQTSDHLDIENLFQYATTREMSDAELAAYSAPFPSEETMAGARMFPGLVASQLRKNYSVFEEFYTKWEKPLLTAFGDKDPLMAGRDKVWQDRVPGAEGQKHVLIKDGAHFIQEDKPEELVDLLNQFIKSN